MNKQLIKNRFSRAVDSYAQSAIAQQQIAEKMTLLIQKHVDNQFETLLEIGSGTGIFSRLLLRHFRFQYMILNDICMDVRVKLSDILDTNHYFLPGDAETIPFPTGIDLITSCSTFQWFVHLESFIQKCQNSLKDNGYIAFSTFGPDNLKEIYSLTGSTLRYRTKFELENLLTGSGFKITHSEEKRITLYFDSPLSVLHHLRNTGVTGIKNFSWTKEKLQRFNDAYISLYSSKKLIPLTYHPVFLIAQKK